MEKSFHRREVLKTLAYFGAGLYLPACVSSTDSKNESEQTTLTDTTKVVKDTIEKPVEKVEEPKPWESDNLEILVRDNKRYSELKQGFNLRVQKSPKAIAICYNTEGVSAAIKYALHYNLPVAIMSGGHSFEGFSSNENGLVINLRSMNRVTALENNKVGVEPP